MIYINRVVWQMEVFFGTPESRMLWCFFLLDGGPQVSVTEIKNVLGLLIFSMGVTRGGVHRTTLSETNTCT